MIEKALSVDNIFVFVLTFWPMTTGHRYGSEQRPEYSRDRHYKRKSFWTELFD